MCGARLGLVLLGKERERPKTPTILEIYDEGGIVASYNVIGRMVLFLCVSCLRETRDGVF